MPFQHVVKPGGKPKPRNIPIFAPPKKPRTRSHRVVAEQLAGEVAGRVVSVYWPVLTNWVDATVQRADMSQCILTVLYNDSVVVNSTVNWLWVKNNLDFLLENQALVTSFLQLVDAHDADDETDSNVLAAMGVMQALTTMCEAVHNMGERATEIFATMEEPLLPLFRRCLQPDSEDYVGAPLSNDAALGPSRTHISTHAHHAYRRICHFPLPSPFLTTQKVDLRLYGSKNLDPVL